MHEVFQHLGIPDRLAVVEMLAKHQVLTVAELTSRMGGDPTAHSAAWQRSYLSLRRLEAVGLVQRVDQYWSIVPEKVREIAEFVSRWA
jgi:hypothetical protein